MFHLRRVKKCSAIVARTRFPYARLPSVTTHPERAVVLFSRMGIMGRTEDFQVPYPVLTAPSERLDMMELEVPGGRAAVARGIQVAALQSIPIEYGAAHGSGNAPCG